MYQEANDLLVRAQFAEYERGVSRLLLESEARKAASGSANKRQPGPPNHHWWELGQRRYGSAA